MSPTYNSLSTRRKIETWVQSIGFVRAADELELSEHQLRNLLYSRPIAAKAMEKVLAKITNPPPPREKRACADQNCVGDGWIGVTDLKFAYANLCKPCRDHRPHTTPRPVRTEAPASPTYPPPTPCPVCGRKRKYDANVLYCPNRCEGGAEVIRVKKGKNHVVLL